MSDKPTLKRYAITIQHEIVVYSYNEEGAKAIALHAYTAKPSCISIKELPPVEVEATGYVVVDNRSAPGQ